MSADIGQVCASSLAAKWAVYAAQTDAALAGAGGLQIGSPLF
jgi:hypothetical protein